MRNIENCNSLMNLIFLCETLGHERPVAMNQNSNAHEISTEESKPGLPGSANVVMASKLIFAILGLPFLRLSPTLQEEVVKDSSASLILEYSLSGCLLPSDMNLETHESCRLSESNTQLQALARDRGE